MYRLINQCLQHNYTSKEYTLSKELQYLKVFTIDKMQGAQKEAIIYYTTNLGNLGFTTDTTYQLLTNSCAQSILIIIRDPSKVSTAYNSSKHSYYLKLAYYKAYYQCLEHKSVVNLYYSKTACNTQAILEGFNITKILQDFYSNKAPNIEPLYLNPNTNYNINTNNNNQDNYNFNNSSSFIEAGSFTEAGSFIEAGSFTEAGSKNSRDSNSSNSKDEGSSNKHGSNDDSNDKDNRYNNNSGFAGESQGTY